MTRQKTYLERKMTKRDKIGDLKPFQKNINLTFKVLRKGRSHKIRKNGSFVSEFLIGDDTGSIILTLWDEDIEMLENDEYFVIYDCYTSIHRNKLKLNKKKYGEIEPELDPGYKINSKNNLSDKKYDEALTLIQSKTIAEESMHNHYNLGQDNVKIIGMDS